MNVSSNTRHPSENVKKGKKMELPGMGSDLLKLCQLFVPLPRLVLVGREAMGLEMLSF